MNLRNILGWLFVLIFFLPDLSTAQISVTAQDFLNQIGTRQIVLEDGRDTVPVNVGSPGPNQVWDFRTQVIGDSLFEAIDFLSLGQTNSAGTFPTANMVQKITDIELPGFENYSFFNMTSDFFINVGDSSRFTTPFDTSFVSFEGDTIAPLPLAFGNTWRSQTIGDTSGIFPTFATISIDTSMNTVDGWGTIRLPLGDFECLRIRQDTHVTNRDYLAGMLTSTSVDSFIQYLWLSKDIFTLARAQSHDGDTDPNFTASRGFGRLDSFMMTPTSVGEPHLALPEQFFLKQNYPNPFNPETLVQYDLDRNGHVELAIFNLLGEKVRSLVDQVQQAGAHQIRWNALDDNGNRVSSGLYLYRLTVNASSQTRRMILMR